MVQKDKEGKTRLDLLPYSALESMAAVREFGNEKYGEPWAWIEDCEVGDFYVAAMRHLYKHNDAMNNPESKELIYDDESGLLHLSHAACSIMMEIVLWHRRDNK